MAIPTSLNLYDETLGGWFFLSTVPLFSLDGKVYGSVLVARDINEQKAHEKKLQQLNDNLERRVVDQIRDILQREQMLQSIFRAAPTGIGVVSAVQDQIRQVWLNLIKNAVDALPVEGGTITIHTQQRGQNFTVSVQDSGEGIKAVDMKHIFEPFFTTKPAIKGTGLGLSVSHGIIESHNGIHNTRRIRTGQRY